MKKASAAPDWQDVIDNAPDEAVDVFMRVAQMHHGNLDAAADFLAMPRADFDCYVDTLHEHGAAISLAMLQGPDEA